MSLYGEVSDWTNDRNSLEQKEMFKSLNKSFYINHKNTNVSQTANSQSQERLYATKPGFKKHKLSPDTKANSSLSYYNVMLDYYRDRRSDKNIHLQSVPTHPDEEHNEYLNDPKYDGDNLNQENSKLVKAMYKKLRQNGKRLLISVSSSFA